MPNPRESQISQETDYGQVTVVGILNDIGGRQYFVKTAAGDYLQLDKNLTPHPSSEAAFASAVLNHGYTPTSAGPTFKFSQRFDMLK